MRRCPNCNAELHEREKVCRNCGAFLDDNIVLEEQTEKKEKKKPSIPKRIYKMQHPLLLLIIAIIIHLTKMIVNNLQFTIPRARLIRILNNLEIATLILIIPVFIIAFIKFIRNKTPKNQMTPHEILISNASLAEQRRMAYIGKNYVKISKKKFSFPAFLLNWIYLFYRKRYILGTIQLLIILTIYVIAQYNSFMYIVLGVFILITAILNSFFFNKMYVKIVTKKTKKIKNKKYKLTSLEFIELCQRKGGTNFFITAIMIVIFALFILIIPVTRLPIINISTKPKEEISEQEQKQMLCKSYAQSIYTSYSKQNISISFIGCDMSDNQSVMIEVYNETTSYIAKYKINSQETLNLIESTTDLESLRQKQSQGILTEEEQQSLTEKEQLEKEFQDFDKNAKENKDLIEIDIKDLD